MNLDFSQFFTFYFKSKKINLFPKATIFVLIIFRTYFSHFSSFVDHLSPARQIPHFQLDKVQDLREVEKRQGAHLVEQVCRNGPEVHLDEEVTVQTV